MSQKSSRHFIILCEKTKNISRIQKRHYKKPDPYLKFDIMSGGYTKIHLFCYQRWLISKFLKNRYILDKISKRKWWRKTRYFLVVGEIKSDFLIIFIICFSFYFHVLRLLDSRRSFFLSFSYILHVILYFPFDDGVNERKMNSFIFVFKWKVLRNKMKTRKLGESH